MTWTFACLSFDLYLESHQKGKAVATCHELLEMNRKSGAKETTAACYQKLIQIDPQAIAIRVEAVEFLFENEMIEQALKQASDLAQLYADRGLLDLSEKMLRRMFDETPSDIQLLRRIIDTHLKVGDERDLYDDYEKLVDQCIEAGSPKDAHQVMERHGQDGRREPDAAHEDDRDFPAISPRKRSG